MTNRQTMTVKLLGAPDDDGAVQFGDFREFCDNLSACLRRVEFVALGHKLRYRIAELRSGSAELTLAPIAGANGGGEVVFALFGDTVKALQLGQPVDRRFDGDDLQAFRKLGEPLTKRARAVWLAGTSVTTQFIANIDRIIGAAIPSEGSVKGSLERLNLHNRNEFVLYTPIGGHSVICSFPDEQFDRVREAIRRNVTVSGTLYFYPDTPYPHRVHVRDIEIHPPDDQLPTLKQLAGAWPDATGSLSAVDFLRARRDE